MTPCQKLFESGQWISIVCPFCVGLAPRYTQLGKEIPRVDLSAFISCAGIFCQAALSLRPDFFHLVEPFRCTGCGTMFTATAVLTEHSEKGGIVNTVIFGQQKNIARPA